MPEVVVIGGANMDVKGRAAERHQQGTSNPGTVTVSPGGVGRNIAENLARLGIDAALITALGHDANGALLREACTSAGVDMSMTVKVIFSLPRIGWQPLICWSPTVTCQLNASTGSAALLQRAACGC
jgi:sugar/nucleoside kinase (ribokinase family)